jgi:acetylornithine deacetylase
MISALWAMLALKQAGIALAGDVLLELIPGEEDCVGLGTLTSVARGHAADAAIILEPTESIPRCASRGGYRFEITVHGRAVHGTVKWLGKDAIATMRLVLDSLEALEARWNDRQADPLFADYPIARPVTVDFVRGGDWQGMVCDRCVCAGYLELLPSDDVSFWRERFERELLAEVAARAAQAGAAQSGTDHSGAVSLSVAGSDTALSGAVRSDATCGVERSDIEVKALEQYDAHTTSPQSSLCSTLEETLRQMHLLSQEQPDDRISDWRLKGWSGFNSGCEAGLRANLLKTPTVVWGPGNLAQAHAADEFVSWREVTSVAAAMAAFVLRWCGSK